MTKILYPLLRFILKINFFVNRYKDPVVWLIADARSGTTWISSLLNYNSAQRELFEPFHEKILDKDTFNSTYPFYDENNLPSKLQAYAGKVFDGNIYNLRIDRASRRLIYKGLLIKDVYTNFFAFGVYTKFPNIKVALLIRQPFAVAVSKYQTRKWNWKDDYTKVLLKDKEFSNRFLEPFKLEIEAILRLDNYFLNQILFWCIYNMIPLIQFQPNQFTLILYEEVLQNPSETIAESRYLLGISRKKEKINLSKKLLNTPSVVSTKTKNFSNQKEIWEKYLSQDIQKKGNEILSIFGMENFYNPNGIPNRAKILEYNLLSQTNPPGR